MKVKIVLFALLLVFTLSSTSNADVIITNGDDGFDEYTFYQICNISTTAWDPSGSFQGVPGVDWRVSWWDGSAYARFGENYGTPFPRATGVWVILCLDGGHMNEITFTGVSPGAYYESQVQLNPSPNGQEFAYTMIGNPFESTINIAMNAGIWSGIGGNALYNAAYWGELVNNFGIWDGNDYPDNRALHDGMNPGNVSLLSGQAGWIATNKTAGYFQDEYSGDGTMIV